MTPGTVWGVDVCAGLKKRRLLRISVLVISRQHHPITSLANVGDRSVQHYIRRWKQE
jgi:hypothetical protein